MWSSPMAVRYIDADAPEHYGLSQRATAYRLGLSREEVRDRLERACQKIREAGGER